MEIFYLYKKKTMMLHDTFFICVIAMSWNHHSCKNCNWTFNARLPSPSPLHSPNVHFFSFIVNTKKYKFSFIRFTYFIANFFFMTPTFIFAYTHRMKHWRRWGGSECKRNGNKLRQKTNHLTIFHSRHL